MAPTAMESLCAKIAVGTAGTEIEHEPCQVGAGVGFGSLAYSAGRSNLETSLGGSAREADRAVDEGLDVLRALDLGHGPVAEVGEMERGEVAAHDVVRRHRRDAASDQGSDREHDGDALAPRRLDDVGVAQPRGADDERVDAPP